MCALPTLCAKSSFRVTIIYSSFRRLSCARALARACSATGHECNFDGFLLSSPSLPSLCLLTPWSGLSLLALLIVFHKKLNFVISPPLPFRAATTACHFGDGDLREGGFLLPEPSILMRKIRRRMTNRGANLDEKGNGGRHVAAKSPLLTQSTRRDCRSGTELS